MDILATTRRDFNPPPSPSDVSGVSSAVLDLVRLGLSLIPIAPGSKRPLIRWTRYQRERPSVKQVERWAEEFPSCNWAACLGRVSGGLVAVDVDSSTAFRWCEIQSGFNAEPPVWYETGRGWQWLFRLPADLLDVRGVNPHEGVEIRSNGQYSVIPPSVHPSGKRYEWRNPPASLEAIPPAPAWIVDLLTGKTQAATERAEGELKRGPVVTRRNHGDVPTLAGLGITKRESSDASPHFRAVNAKLLESSAYTWLMRSKFLKGNRRQAFYNLVLIQKGAGLTERESWDSLEGWRERRCSPAYGSGNVDPDEPRRVFDCVWRGGYRPTIHHLREPVNSRGQRATVASARMLCKFYPDTRRRSKWLHEPALVGVFRILVALARHRIGLDRPEILTHRQLAVIAGISERRVGHAASILTRLGIRELARKGRSPVSTYDTSILRTATLNTVCSAFGRWTEGDWPMVLLWRRVMRCFGGLVRRLSEALRSLKRRAGRCSVGETGSSGLRSLSGVAWAVSGRGPP